MFAPHHYYDHGRFGGIFNEKEDQWCGYSLTADNTILTWNDPITQVTMLSAVDLQVAKVWITGQLLRRYEEVKVLNK